MPVDSYLASLYPRRLRCEDFEHPSNLLRRDLRAKVGGHDPARQTFRSKNPLDPSASPDQRRILLRYLLHKSFACSLLVAQPLRETLSSPVLAVPCRALPARHPDPMQGFDDPGMWLADWFRRQPVGHPSCAIRCLSARSED